MARKLPNNLCVIPGYRNTKIVVRERPMIRAYRSDTISNYIVFFIGRHQVATGVSTENTWCAYIESAGDLIKQHYVSDIASEEDCVKFVLSYLNECIDQWFDAPKRDAKNLISNRP